MNVQKTNNTIDKVRELQRKLYLAAKANKKRRFHALFDKVYRKDVLQKAWQQVKANGGVAISSDLIASPALLSAGPIARCCNPGHGEQRVRHRVGT